MPTPACRACGAGITDRPSFRETCPKCSTWLHVCEACAHYDPAAYHECKASATAEYVADKAKFNFCEEFKLNTAAPGTAKTSRADAERLFGNLP